MKNVQGLGRDRAVDFFSLYLFHLYPFTHALSVGSLLAVDRQESVLFLVEKLLFEMSGEALIFLRGLKSSFWYHLGYP